MWAANHTYIKMCGPVKEKASTWQYRKKRHFTFPEKLGEAIVYFMVLFF